MDTPTLEFNHMEFLTNFAGMNTTPGRFATRIGLSSTDDPVAHMTRWFVISSGGNLYHEFAGCTGRIFVADPIYSVDQDYVAVRPGTLLNFNASIVLDVYTPDFASAPLTMNFPSYRNPANGSCIATSGSLKAREVQLTTSGITFTNNMQMRY
jgi:hypothetical protein